MIRSNDGKHDTTVHEKVAPAVQNESIAHKEHEQQTTAVDREVHQDHYHTSEQPVTHSEVLPEQHHHKAAPVEHRSFEHDNADKVNDRLDDEHKKYYDTQTRVEGEKTRSHDATVQGEHVHHHVHETIQPVVQKRKFLSPKPSPRHLANSDVDTVEPHVVHTTVPIHEVHHNEAHHHASTALPPVSMDEFKKQGGTLGGREERHTRHEAGEPQSIGGHNVRDDRRPVAGTTDHSGMDNRTKQATTERIGTDSRTNPSTGLDNYGSTTDRVGADSHNNNPNTSFGKHGPTTDSSRYESATGHSGERIGTDGPLSG